MKFKECGECTICCDGYLIGSAYGREYGSLHKCHFMEETCLIYDVRPAVCRQYFCAWVQNLFPDYMRPDKCGVLISVESNPDTTQYLKVIYKDDIKLSIVDEILKFSEENKCKVVYVKI